MDDLYVRTTRIRGFLHDEERIHIRLYSVWFGSVQFMKSFTLTLTQPELIGRQVTSRVNSGYNRFLSEDACKQRGTCRAADAVVVAVGIRANPRGQPDSNRNLLK